MPCLPERLAALERAPDGATLLRWATQIAEEALRWIHAKTRDGRIPVHRDIKPENILLTAEGDLRLIDFGIAKAMGGTGTLGHRDAAYFAPEQRLPIQPGACAEDDVVAPSPKSDLYCLGLILFRMTIGRSAVPNAQLRLREDRIRSEHIAKLNAGGRGLIGEIGGLEAKERRELKDAAISLLQGGAAGTLVFQGRPSLPDLPLLAETFVEQVGWLLAPDPAERPDAAEARTAFERLQDALVPSVERIASSAVPSEVTAEEELTLRVEVVGRGLPAHGRWLQLSVDGKPASIEPTSESRQEPFVSGTHHWDFSDRPTLDQAGPHRAEVRCQAAGKTYEASVEYLVKATSEQLWATGEPHRRLEALGLDPRPEWLDRLVREARTLGDRARLLERLKQLHDQHPDNEGLARRIRDIENAPVVTPSYLRPLVYALTVAMVAVGGYWLLVQTQKSAPPGPPPPATAGQPSKAVTPAVATPDPVTPTIETPASAVTEPAPLETPPPGEPDTDAALAQAATGGDPTAIQAAIPELTRRAQAGDGDAHLWLGYLRATGVGVAEDRPQARRHYQKALELGADEAQAAIDDLDRLADLLLRSRDPAERTQGYALAEAAAEAGDVNALVWLGYRYDRGDGVSPDAAEAARWYAAAEQAGDRVAAERLTELRR